MKKLSVMIMAGVLVCILCACANATEGSSVQKEPGEVEKQDQPETKDTATEQRNSLVAYFTYGENANLLQDVDASSSASVQIWNDEITGNAGVIAHILQEAAGAELFSIKTSTLYPDTYDATVDQGKKENEEDVRPELTTHIENLASYDTIYVVFPNWWYDMPMVMYSFFEEYDFAGKTIVVFTTSGGSGFSDTISTIQTLEPNAKVVEGLSIGASQAMTAQADIEAWLASNNIQ